jgi:hypothetical protein
MKEARNRAGGVCYQLFAVGARNPQRHIRHAIVLPNQLNSPNTAATLSRLAQGITGVKAGRQQTSCAMPSRTYGFWSLPLVAAAESVLAAALDVLALALAALAALAAATAAGLGPPGAAAALFSSALTLNGSASTKEPIWIKARERPVSPPTNSICTQQKHPQQQAYEWMEPNHSKAESWRTYNFLCRIVQIELSAALRTLKRAAAITTTANEAMSGDE